MRKDTQHLIPRTPGSTRLCEDIARRAEGVCLFGFSRGKDSIAAWLQLRRFFHTIIPFHIATVPHLSFIDRALAYYEKEFQTKIHRVVSGDSRWLMANLVFQPGGDDQAIDKISLGRYNNNDVADVMREIYTAKHGGPMPDKGWVAYGMAASDSMFRRLRMTEKGTRTLRKDAGYRESTRVFFPCYDWSRDQIMKAVEVSGLRLPDDYHLSNRTLAHIDHSQLPRLRALYPEDFQRVKAMFPFIEAHIARNEFRKRKQHQ